MKSAAFVAATHASTAFRSSVAAARAAGLGGGGPEGGSAASVAPRRDSGMGSRVLGSLIGESPVGFAGASAGAVSSSSSSSSSAARCLAASHAFA